MSFRPPFHAVPIKADKRYRRKRRVQKNNALVTYLGGAALVGAAVGVGSVALTPDGISSLASVAKTFVAALDGRARKPQPGDYWSGCDAARSAGTAPIYVGEPGYREGLDGDGDGVACEPYRGR